MRSFPPEFQPFDKQRYFADLSYRYDQDKETYAERHEGLKLLMLFCPALLNT